MREGAFARPAFDPFRDIPGILGAKKSARTDVRGYDEPRPPRGSGRQSGLTALCLPRTTFDFDREDMKLRVRGSLWTTTLGCFVLG